MSNEVEIVVTGSDRTGSLFSRIRSSFASQFKGISQNAAREGKKAGQNFSRNLKDSIRQGGQKVTDAVQTVLTGALQGALKGPAAGPAIVSALLVAVTAAAPVIGAALGGAIVLGFGAAIVGLSAAALLHTEKINKDWSDAEQARVRESNKQGEKLKHQWRETFRDVVNGLKEASQPLIPVLDTARQVIRDVGKEFKPVIESALALGVMVVIEAEHGCMSIRGVKEPCAATVTSAVRGEFKDDPGARQEFMALRSRREQ